MNEYILYIERDCPLCIRAIDLLKSLSEPYSIIDLSEFPSILKSLKEIYDWQTVPIIFKKEGKFQVMIGGFSDLEAYSRPLDG